MKLESLALSDFRAFHTGAVTVPSNGIVLIFGENNAGKTSLLSAFDSLTELDGPMVAAHVGGAGNAGLNATFRLSPDDRGRFLGPDWLATPAFTEMEFRYSRIAGGFGPAIVRAVDTNGDWQTIATLDERRHLNSIPFFEVFGFRPNSDWNLSQAEQGSQNILVQMGPLRDVFQEWVRGVYHFGSLRQGTTRSRPIGSHPFLETSGANLPEALLYLRTNREDKWAEFIDAVELILPGVGTLQTPTNGEISVVFQDPVTGARHNLKDMGSGVEQLLLTAFVAVSQPDGSLIILEEPETNLHPGAQRR